MPIEERRERDAEQDRGDDIAARVSRSSASSAPRPAASETRKPIWNGQRMSTQPGPEEEQEQRPRRARPRRRRAGARRRTAAPTQSRWRARRRPGRPRSARARPSRRAPCRRAPGTSERCSLCGSQQRVEVPVAPVLDEVPLVEVEGRVAPDVDAAPRGRRDEQASASVHRVASATPRAAAAARRPPARRSAATAVTTGSLRSARGDAGAACAGDDRLRRRRPAGSRRGSGDARGTRRGR